MSIRTCAWPDCPARFPTDQGPSVAGWQIYSSQGGRVLLCPFHTSYGHGPLVERKEGEKVWARFLCVCSRWEGEYVDSLVRALGEWQEHIRVTV